MQYAVLNETQINLFLGNRGQVEGHARRVTWFLHNVEFVIIRFISY